MNNPKTSPAPPPPALILELLSLPGVSGDEAAIAERVAKEAQSIEGVTIHRIGDNVVAVRGIPRVAVFAHTDTIGFTLGYDRRLIPIGSPQPEDREPLHCTDGSGLQGRVRKNEEGVRLRRVRTSDGKRTDATPGSRWIYARAPKFTNRTLTSPYLDDRAGVWAALQALSRCPHIAVAFCTGEEQHGHGARVCADWLYRTHGITEALIADITWHTKDTPCGKGVVLSLRDAFCPRQVFLDRVLSLSAESGIPHQREVQSAGSSDGGHILRSPVPIDWVFVGAPEKRPHTSREQVELSDLHAMADLLSFLAARL